MRDIIASGGKFESVLALCAPIISVYYGPVHVVCVFLNIYATLRDVRLRGCSHLAPAPIIPGQTIGGVSLLPREKLLCR